MKLRWRAAGSSSQNAFRDGEKRWKKEDRRVVSVVEHRPDSFPRTRLARARNPCYEASFPSGYVDRSRSGIIFLALLPWMLPGHASPAIETAFSDITAVNSDGVPAKWALRGLLYYRGLRVTVDGYTDTSTGSQAYGGRSSLSRMQSAEGRGLLHWFAVLRGCFGYWVNSRRD